MKCILMQRLIASFGRVFWTGPATRLKISQREREPWLVFYKDTVLIG